MKRIARWIDLFLVVALMLAQVVGAALAQGSDGASVSGTDESETLTGTEQGEHKHEP